SAFVEELPGDASRGGVAPAGGDVHTLALAADPAGHPFLAWDAAAAASTPQVFVRGDRFDLGAVYHVAAGGSVSGDGSAASPLASVQQVLDARALHPGDLILVHGTTDPAGITVTAADSGVTILGVPGESAAVQGPVVITGASGVTLQGLGLGSVTASA